MKIQTLFKKLETLDKYQEFKKESASAFFCAGFFIMDFKRAKFEYSLDFRDDKNVYGFKIPQDESEQLVFTSDPLIETPKPLEKIDTSLISKIKTDIEDLKELIEEALFDNSIKNILEEVIAVLQSLNGTVIWNLTCILSSLSVVNVQIDPFSGEIIKFEKKNLLDFASIKKLDKK